MILVVGATGFLGGEICRRLAEREKLVRALVRPTSNPQKVQRLKDLGVELVKGDLKDRESLDRACRGADAVISTASTTISRQQGDTIERVERQGQIDLVDAAKAAGVSHFVYISFSGSINILCALCTAKRSVERHLRESGMTYTTLRPSVFMEVWLSPALSFDYAEGKARIFGSGENPISYISLGDVAEFAVQSLDNPAARNATFELGGPEAVAPNDVVRIFEEVTGRKFAVERVPEEALRAHYESAVDPLEKSFAALTLGCAQGDPIPMDGTLGTFPVQLTSVREYAEQVANH